MRQELPWVPIEKEYVFDTEEGPKSLTELFDGRSQLLVYHFMFGYGYRLTDERQGCTGCSLIADHFDGVIPHLNGRDITLVCASIAPLPELHDYKWQMGWRFPRFASPNDQIVACRVLAHPDVGRPASAGELEPYRVAALVQTGRRGQHRGQHATSIDDIPGHA